MHFTLLTCPFCFNQKVSGTVLNFDFPEINHATPQNKFLFSIFGRCNHCLSGVVAHALTNSINSHDRYGKYKFELFYSVAQDAIKSHTGSIESCTYIETDSLTWFPKPPKIDIPANLPKNVEEKFLQAERLSNQIDMRDPAGNAFRATLERSILHIDAALTGGNLYSKIEKLAKNGQITEDLKDFAHQIRVLGNDATLMMTTSHKKN